MTDKKPFRSRGKGKTGEREVAKICVAWWSVLEPGCEFKSTPLSGGFSTPTVRGAFKIAGDLMTTAKKWPFTVEVKRREGFALKNLFAGKPSPVWGWWRQCVAAAREEGRVPMLWFRKNGTLEWMLMLPRKAFPWVPSFDSWDTAPLNVDVAGCAPMLTTWDAFKQTASHRAIIRSCHAFELPPALSSPISLSTRRAQQQRQPSLPLPGLDPPPQPAGARLPAARAPRTKASALSPGSGSSKPATGSASAAASSAKAAGAPRATRALRLVPPVKGTQSPFTPT